MIPKQCRHGLLESAGPSVVEHFGRSFVCESMRGRRSSSDRPDVTDRRRRGSEHRQVGSPPGLCVSHRSPAEANLPQALIIYRAGLLLTTAKDARLDLCRYRGSSLAALFLSVKRIDAAQSAAFPAQLIRR